MDDFSDDGLDGLNDNALQELENNAIQFTQVQKGGLTQGAPLPRSSSYNFELEDDDLDETVVIDELAQVPIRSRVDSTVPPRAAPTITTPRPWNSPRQGQPSVVQAGYPTPARATGAHGALPDALYPPRPILANRPVPPKGGQIARPPPPVPGNSRYSAQPSQAPPVHVQNDILAQLQLRVRELEGDLYTAKGEATLMRTKFNESRVAHEADVARLKKQNAEQLAKQERIAAAAIAAEKSAATELEFTRQDLEEEIGRAKKGRKDGGVATPRKPNGGRFARDVADGFDDVEILPSPSKAPPRRAKDPGPIAGPVFERTPTKGKRKRPTVESPVAALETHSDEAAAQGRGVAVPVEVASLHWRPNALPFDFLQLVLDHASLHGRRLTFDLFASYTFPSDPSQSLAALIFQKLPRLGSPEDPHQLLVDFCELILDLWSKCLTEKYHDPIFELVQLLTFVLQLNTMAVAPRIVSSLLPIAQTAVYLVAVPIFNSADGNTAEDPSLDRLYAGIDTLHILSAMYLTALGCASSLPETVDPSLPAPPSAQAQFWRLMQIEFVLMMLSPKQRPDDILAVLSILGTSALPDSIGPVTGDRDRHPNFVALVLIDRVTYHLTDLPRWTAPGSYKQCQVRLAVLSTLMSFAQSPYGKLKLAASDVAIPRMATMLCGAIEALYDMDVPHAIHTVAVDPAESQTEQGDRVGRDLNVPSDKEEDAVPLLLRLISATTLLLHSLITDSATCDAANLPAKLTCFQGGYQRYLLSLARLSFAEEELVFEAGLDADTVELAHELLELAVTPDEGDGVGEVFGL